MLCHDLDACHYPWADGPLNHDRAVDLVCSLVANPWAVAIRTRAWEFEVAWADSVPLEELELVI